MRNLEIPRESRFQILILMSLFLGVGNVAFAQEKQVKKVPIQTSPANSGAEMYKQYCAACHGKTGKGDGPAASALKQAPADLTTLAQRHDGKFPAAYVAAVLRNGVKSPAHGDAEMPVWGPLFLSLNEGQPIVDMRIANLTNYIKSLQVK
jgi:mono/diheme cytochrome c family protein